MRSEPRTAADRRPVIGITSSAHVLSIGPEPYDVRYTPAELDGAVLAAGGLPIHLPNLGAAEAREVLELIDGLILAGGCDVDPQLYGGERLDPPPFPEYEPARDASEREFVDAALGGSTPVLGICRGLQLLNVVLGGSLGDDDGHYYQPVPLAGPTHPLLIEPGSQLEAIFGSTRIEVNSVHNQMIERLGSELMVSARSQDGVIEAIQLARDHSWVIGVQWHPEAMAAEDANQRRLFEALVEEARIRRSDRVSN